MWKCLVWRHHDDDMMIYSFSILKSYTSKPPFILNIIKIETIMYVKIIYINGKLTKKKNV